METSQTLEESSYIRVLLLPVGTVSSEKLERVTDILKTFRFVPYLALDSASKEQKGGDSTSSLRNLDEQNARLHFTMLSADKAWPSDWEDLYYYRRILAVIGIVDCNQWPTWGDLGKASFEFMETIKSAEHLRHIKAKTCIALDPLLGQIPPDFSSELGRTHEDLAVVQAGSIAHQTEHLQDIIISLAQRLRTNLEEDILRLEKSDKTPLTPLDPRLSALVFANRRMRSARIDKQTGDIALLLGSPVDALHRYQDAIDDSKREGDTIWTSAAHEGIAASLLTRIRQMIPGLTLRDVETGEHLSWLNDATASIAHALDGYKKKPAPLLFIETSLKAARVSLELGDRTYSSQLLGEAYSESDCLSIQEKIQLATSISQIYEIMGMMRKFAFYVREAALLSKSIVLPHKAHALLKLTAPHYHLTLPSPSSIPSSSPSSNLKAKSRRETQWLEAGRPWVAVHASVFDSLIDISAELADPYLPIQYLLAYLSIQGRYLNSLQQEQLVARLAAYVKRFPVLLDTGSPGFLSLEPVEELREENYGGAIEEVAVEDTESSGPFLYRPKRIVKESLVVETPVLQAATNTSLHLNIVISNVFNVPVTIEHLRVSGKGIQCKPLAKLDFKSLESRKVELTISAVDKGLVTELDLIYRSFNCLMTQKLRMGVHIDFIDPLPTLSVVSISPGDPKIELFNGQRHRVTLRLTNEGVNDITMLQVDAKEHYLADDSNSEDAEIDAALRKKPRSLRWDTSLVEKYLPLKPGDSFELPLEISAHDFCPIVTLLFEYGSSAYLRWHRKLSMPFNFTVDPGLRVTAFDILECTYDALKRFSDLPPHDKIIGLLEAEDESLAQSAYVLCVFDVLNETAHPFHLQVNPEIKLEGNDQSTFFTSKSFITLEAMAVRRVMVAIRKFFIPQNEFPVIEPALRKYLTKDKGFTEEQFSEFQSLEVYSSRLLSQVILEWHAVVNNAQGRLPLHALRLTKEQLNRIMRQDVVVDLTTNAPVCKCHELITLDAHVFNLREVHSPIKPSAPSSNPSSSSSSPASSSSSSPVLDSLEVSLVPTLLLSSFSFSWVNRINNVPVAPIQPGSRGKLSFSICFHEVGMYELVALCKDTFSGKEYWSRRVQIIVKH